MSSIRYRYKSEKDEKLFQFNGTSCSLGDFKRFLVGKPSKLPSRRSKDDIDFTVNDAYSNEGLSQTVALYRIDCLSLV